MTSSRSDSPAGAGTVLVATARYVTIALAAAVTGLTEKAIRAKCERGVWIQDREWRRAPDGRIYIDMERVAKWVERATA